MRNIGPWWRPCFQIEKEKTLRESALSLSMPFGGDTDIGINDDSALMAHLPDFPPDSVRILLGF